MCFVQSSDLHPLALEDILNQRIQARSKADYYRKHLFLRVLCHTLAPSDDICLESLNPLLTQKSPLAMNNENIITSGARSASPLPMNGFESTDLGRPEGRHDEEKTVFGIVPTIRRLKTGIFKSRPLSRHSDIERKWSFHGKTLAHVCLIQMCMSAPKAVAFRMITERKISSQ
jgi:hypothetical protein